MLYERICNEHLRLEKRIVAVQEQMGTLPDGKLICCEDGNFNRWYKSDGHNKVYIPRKQRILAEQLAVKKYLSLELEYLEREKRTLEFYLRHHASQMETTESLFSDHSGYKDLLAPYFSPKSKELFDWMNTPYEKNSNYPEHLIHKTCTGEFVRSKSEAMISFLLHTNQIPFRYECALHLGETTIFPDFTIRHPDTGEIYYWEHFGRMDDLVYSQNTCTKLQLYTAHGIIPSIQLITTYETKEHPLSSEDIERILKYYFL